MKDEFGGVIIDEFVGLMSKMFSMKKADDKEYNTAKGVSITTEFKEFKDVLFNEKMHKLGAYDTDKISLSCFDDKRCVLQMCQIKTLVYFHKDSVTNCKEIEKDCDN